MGQFTHEQLIEFCIFFPILLLSIALHEFAHCWTNDRLGDDTPRREGRVTLNPFAHLDPMGTIMVAVCALSGLGMGWGKPSPFNAINFRHPARDRMIGALAGPFSNILQMLAWASILMVIRSFVIVTNPLAPPLLMRICFDGMMINAGLAVFNLIPIYPLDGHHILSYFAPPSWRPVIDNPRWAYVFLLVVLFPSIRDTVLIPVMDPLRHGLFVGTYYLVFGQPPL